MFDEQNEKLEDLAHYLVLRKFPKKIPTEAEIKQCLVEARILVPDVTDEQCDQILRRLLTRLQVTMEIGVAVIDDDVCKPWLKDRRDISFFYWNRYKQYLEKIKGWNSVVIETLGRVTDEILDLTGNPANETRWQRRGLVMGNVQSGKTANYTALANKAMDAGYRVIIILAGMQENLRRQTQERLDVELVGLDSQLILDQLGRKLPVGVGRIDGNHFVATFTSKYNDFDQKILNNLNLRINTCAEPVVFVVKKQKQRLTYLEKWLRTFNAGSDGLIDLPMLLIDDEADNASVNTKSDDNPTVINECIRRLLELFKRASYVGVTATPYANIFINPESDQDMLGNDLFPRDFIYSLTPPTNYIGNNAIFGDDDLYDLMICEIDDGIEESIPIKHKSTHVVDDLPDSMYTALYYFLLTNVIRDMRGPRNNHRSMLVNVSRFTKVQGQVRDHIHAWLERVKSSVRNFASLEPVEALRNIDISRFKAVWDAFDLNKLCDSDWRTVQQQWLDKAIANISVVEVNQRSEASVLDYEAHKKSGLRVIAVGGNSLSRGLTLEGLCVSYFYRNSQMYDTLLQMGRWFGYRPGYEDLCKIWMTDEAIECYSHITRATDELRDEIYLMRHYRMTPREFGLKVRSHPGSTERMVGKLLVTARNKMQHAADYIHAISVSRELFETPKLLIDQVHLMGNYNLTRQFVSDIENNYSTAGKNIHTQNHKVWVNVPASKIASFVRGFTSDPFYLKFQADGLADFIAGAPHLYHWDVAIPEGDGSEFTIIPGCSIKKQERGVDISKNNRSLRVSGPKLRVGSRPCTKYGLDTALVEEITKNKQKDKQQVSDKAFLEPDRKPLLLLHFIEIKLRRGLSEEHKELVEKTGRMLDEENICLVALGIGFPTAITNDSMYARYKINKVKQEQLLEAFEETEDADD